MGGEGEGAEGKRGRRIAGGAKKVIWLKTSKDGAALHFSLSTSKALSLSSSLSEQTLEPSLSLFLFSLYLSPPSLSI